ncbi:prolipoprotein diacylglyceryl transferase [Clostridia bacterium]|nr:prolipoprotein diacylglyceryl transferase [Clostridia bacterium]
MSIPPLGSIAFGSVPWYSVLVALAFAIGARLAINEEKRRKMPKDTMIDFLLLAIPLAIIGARLYYVAFEWDIYRGNILRILNVREGGLAIYGGIITGSIAAIITAKRKKIPFLALVDACIPSLILGQAIGRWGNYANMEAYGRVITYPSWQWFPVGVQILENGGLVWHQATFFYESMWCFAGFFILSAVKKRPIKDGMLFYLYLLFYGIERAFVEGMRMDSLYVFGSLRVSQLLSILMVVVAVIALYKNERCKKPTERAEG